MRSWTRVVVGALCCWLVSVATRADDRPNILLILADDMGWSDAGCYGGEIPTPNLDRLAEEGLRFTQFYNCSMCFPTRGALLYGVYPQQARGGRAERCISLAEALKSVGYRTLMTGKWGVSQSPTARGFDHYYGLLGGASNHFNPGNQRPGQRAPAFKSKGRFRRWAEDGKVFRPYSPADPKFYSTDAFTDRAIEYLDRYKGEAKPFFLYLSYSAPHFPIQAPKEDVDRFLGKYKIGWDVVRQRRFDRQKRLGVIPPHTELSKRDPGGPLRLSRREPYHCVKNGPWTEVKNQDEWDIKMAVYAAMIVRMDRNIGRVLKKIEELDETDNTVVLFLSDNGACAEAWHATPDVPPGPLESYRTVDLPWANASNTPFRKFKMGTHEGGIATPFIVRWPGRIAKEGAITPQIGHVMDLLPTFCEIAGVELPRTRNGSPITPSEGTSLVPVLEGKKRTVPEYLFWENLGHKSVRQGRWKLLGYGDSSATEKWELYDLERDRAETKNIAAAHPDRVRQMSRAWVEWARRTGLQ
ncbi:MAG: arylsulfatase [Planctomycetota bacterium]